MMIRFITLLCIALLPFSVSAHGPSRLKVTESLTIDAAPEVVWAIVKNFDALAKWHPAVADSPAENGNAVGSVRNLVLKDGGKLVETLERYDDAKMLYSYRAANGGALPVANYSSTLQLAADKGKTVVTWRAGFYRMNPALDAPKGENDESAIEAVTAVYRMGLAHLKTLIEKK